MTTKAVLLTRALLASALAFSFAQAAEQDDPPIGKGRFILYEDFEGTSPGSAPKGFQKDGKVGVAADAAHSGRQSLRIEAAATGPRRITISNKDIMTQLGGQHWGRLYFKVQQPSPQPDNGVIHSTLVGGTAKSPLPAKDGIEVRVLDTVMNNKGEYQYIYNVQPQKRGEFGKGGGYKSKFTDEWTLAEWYVDYAMQTYRLFINEKEVTDVAFTKGAGNYEGGEIPEVFESLSFGWNNYQNAGKGFVAWIDDIALAKDRIGSRGVPVANPRSPELRRTSSLLPRKSTLEVIIREFHADAPPTVKEGQRTPSGAGWGELPEEAGMLHHHGRIVLLLSTIVALGCGGPGGGGGGVHASGTLAASGVPWQSQDIGTVGFAGATAVLGSGFQVTASGGDIWDTADGFRFVYKPLSGDGEIVAQVDSLNPTDAWAKAGVMIRETLAANSSFAMTVVTPSNGTGLQYRTATGAGAGMSPTGTGAAPCWVRLVRAGNTFTGSASADGSSWTTLGSISFTMAANTYIGLCVTAHTNSASTIAVLDSIALQGTSTPPTVVFGNLQPVLFSQVALNDNFWAPRIEKNRITGLPVMYQSFVDNHNLDNFSKAAGLMSGNHDGFLWADSDVYKTLEGMAKAIKLHPDANLQSKLEGVITTIAAAQIPQGQPLAGYIDTYFQLGNAGRGDGGSTVTTQPWQDPRSMHEDYCHGHLIEAALAHHLATGQTTFLDVARKLADHLENRFGVGKTSIVPGHQEVEIALMKLWSLPGTGKQADLDQAKFYLDERGRYSGGRTIFGEYCQDLAPIKSMTEPQGHGVRGPYMWAAGVDVAAATSDTALLTALDAIWQNIVDKKMHVTGGTGNRQYNEGYAPDYDLAPEEAYNETCSGCATMMFSHRLANLKADGKYMDVLERILYNTFASGHSLDVSRFYYNDLMTRTQTKGRMGIACCATNTVRVLPSIPGYQYAVKDGDGIWTHLYMAGQAQITLDGTTVGLKQETNYPWDGNVKLTASLPGPDAFTLHLRIPAWAAGATATVNGAPVNMGAISQGYVSITRTWSDGDVVQLTLPMAIRRVYSNPKVVSHQGRVAIARGPIVYCLESNDNSIPVHKIVIPSGAGLTASYNGGLLGGVTTISGTGINADTSGSVGFTMIPYGVWDNRTYDSSLMTVMIPETVGAVNAPLDKNRVGNATISYSYKNAGDTETALNDGLIPPGDQFSAPRFTWWSHQGTSEWVQYDLPAPVTISRSDILWFEDASQGGGCDYPQTFDHQYWNGSSWQPMQLLHDYMNMIDLYGGHFTIVRFTPVTTSKIRLNVQLRPGKSAGILEWRLPEN